MRFLLGSMIVACFFIGQSSSQNLITAEDRVEILRAHNHVRSLVSPTAANMRRLVYSEELEAVAKVFADRCVFAHSNRVERNSLSPTFTFVGENIYVGTGVTTNYTDIIARQFGFNEAASYDYDTNTCDPGAVCGHYTQIAWADTTHVGCSHARCSSVENFLPGLEADLIFCNYGPAGNIGSRLPYIAGSPCSACPSDLPMCIERLCSPQQAPPTTPPITTAPTTTRAPTTEPATTGAPTTEPATTGAPTTEPATTGAPTTEPPTTGAPTTEPATTGAPTTEPATTGAPTTEPATTGAPTTEPATTGAPTTEPATTGAPTTEPTTGSPATTDIGRPIPPDEFGIFVDNTPHVDGSRISISIRFSSDVLKAVCSLTGQPDMDCSSGGINYILPNFDTYKYLRILIRTEMVGGGVGRMTRVIKVGPPHLCIVNFINEGVRVFTNGTAMLEFTSSGPTSTFLCSMDRGPLSPCRKGQMYSGLSLGAHRIKVVADNCGRNRRNGVLKFNIKN